MATKIYQLRDQHQGVLAAYSWTEPPTAEQLAPILAGLGGRVLVPGPRQANALAEEHLASPGGVHAGRGWCFVVETELHGPSDIVRTNDNRWVAGVADQAQVKAAAQPMMVGSGVGKVE